MIWKNARVLSVAMLAGALGVTTLSAAPAGKATSTSGAAAKQEAAASQGTQYSEPMRRLLEAAQKLRDATHSMAASGAGRTDAIKQANEALLETQAAMLAIPFEIRQTPDSAPNYQKSMDRLKQAAQKLRDAAQALAEKSGTDGRHAAIRQVNDALMETQQAMIDLLPDSETGASTTGQAPAQK